MQSSNQAACLKYSRISPFYVVTFSLRRPWYRKHLIEHQKRDSLYKWGVHEMVQVWLYVSTCTTVIHWKGHWVGEGDEQV